MPISQRSFGVTGEGREVILYTLSNDDGMSVEVMNYGGIIRAIEVPDRNGEQADITLGFDTLNLTWGVILFSVHWSDALPIGSAKPDFHWTGTKFS